MDDTPKEFKKIRNIIGKILGYRVPEGGIMEFYRTLNTRGELTGKEMFLLFKVIEYLDKKEDEVK